MRTDVARLPVQHKRKPHCATCGAALTVFDHVSIMVPAGVTQKIVRITLQVACDCGEEWLLSTLT